jgi:hypothetical protein
MTDAAERKKGVEAEREPNFLLAVRAFGNLRELAREEPSAPRR